MTDSFNCQERKYTDHGYYLLVTVTNKKFSSQFYSFTVKVLQQIYSTSLAKVANTVQLTSN